MINFIHLWPPVGLVLVLRRLHLLEVAELLRDLALGAMVFSVARVGWWRGGTAEGKC